MTRIHARAAVLALAGALAYATSLSGPFLFDDDAAIVENAQIRSLRPSVALAPQRESPTAGRPLVNYTFAINYAAGGLNVTGYHAANIAIHLVCALVLFGVVRRTLEWPSIPQAVRQRADDLGFAVALIWVVHPLNSEAVDYLTQRTESLMGLFYLLTVYWAMRGGGPAEARPERARPSTGSGRASRRAGRPVLLSIFCCALGMACKESMVTAPIMVIAYDRLFRYDSLKRAWRERWPLYAGLAMTWVLLGVLIASGPRMYSAGFETGISPWTYLLNQAVMIVRYLRLAIWPRSLVLAYGIPLPLSFVDVLPQILLVVALIAVTVVALVRRPLLGFLGLWFFVTLAPTSTIVPIATEVGAERRMYLPLMALVAAAVFTAGARIRRTAALVLLAALSTALAVQTTLRHREYVSSSVMADTILDRWPTGFAHARVGIELARAGDHDRALLHLRESVASYPKGRFPLGVELFATGRHDEALAQLRQFVAEEPRFVEAVRARTIVGRILLEKRRYADAIPEFEAVLTMTAPEDEAHATATGFLADARFGQGRFADALRLYESFLASRPTDSGALTNYGIALASTGRPREATQAFQRAVSADPTDAHARRNLAKALLNEDRLDAADAEISALLRLNDADAVGHDLKGRVLAARGDLARARAEFERAVALDPGDAQAREDVALVLRALGARASRD